MSQHIVCCDKGGVFTVMFKMSKDSVSASNASHDASTYASKYKTNLNRLANTITTYFYSFSRRKITSFTHGQECQEDDLVKMSNNAKKIVLK
jgi:hypothetical protein